MCELYAALVTVPLYRSVILLQVVVQVLGSAVFEVIAEDLVEGRRVASVLVRSDLVRRCSGDRHGRAEEQCGHGILHLPSSEGLVYPNPPPDGKLARNLTEPYLGHRDPNHTVHYTRIAGSRFEDIWRR